MGNKESVTSSNKDDNNNKGDNGVAKTIACKSVGVFFAWVTGSGFGGDTADSICKGAIDLMTGPRKG